MYCVILTYVELIHTTPKYVCMLSIIYLVDVIQSGDQIILFLHTLETFC